LFGWPCLAPRRFPPKGVNHPALFADRRLEGAHAAPQKELRDRARQGKHEQHRRREKQDEFHLEVENLVLNVSAVLAAKRPLTHARPCTQLSPLSGGMRDHNHSAPHPGVVLEYPRPQQDLRRWT
jgi:hypothetical protein